MFVQAVGGINLTATLREGNGVKFKTFVDLSVIVHFADCSCSSLSF